MASNFDFLTTGWATLNEDAVETELNVFPAPRTQRLSHHPPNVLSPNFKEATAVREPTSDPRRSQLASIVC